MNDAADRLPWETGAQIATLEAEVARLTQERDKWLDNFNRSEQFQNGPTKRAEAAEARLAALTAALEGLEQHWREHVAGLRDSFEAKKIEAVARIYERCAGRLAALRPPEER